MIKRPSGQQVCVAWLKSLTELSGIAVSTTLPEKWTGLFAIVGPSLGGIPFPGRVTRVPVIQIDCFAKEPNSDRPAWNQASILAEAIRDATYGSQQYGVLTIPGNYLAANLSSVIPMSEPRRVQGDVTAIARYTMNMQFTFTPVDLAIV